VERTSRTGQCIYTGLPTLKFARLTRPRIPFYSTFKSLFFLYLSSSHTEVSDVTVWPPPLTPLLLHIDGHQGASYIYRTHLAPFFHEHEPDIDAFISSLRSRAGEAVVQGAVWVWEKAKTQLNVSLIRESAQLSAHKARNTLCVVSFALSQGRGPSMYDERRTT
jgi:hypothetical protein